MSRLHRPKCKEQRVPMSEQKWTFMDASITYPSYYATAALCGTEHRMGSGFLSPTILFVDLVRTGRDVCFSGSQPRVRPWFAVGSVSWLIPLVLIFPSFCHYPFFFPSPKHGSLTVSLMSGLANLLRHSQSPLMKYKRCHMLGMFFFLFGPHFVLRLLCKGP